MRFSRLLILFFVLLSLAACNKYEKENNHLKDELRMVREENDYLKAEIVGLKKELSHLAAKVEDEREGLQKKFQEEREALQKKTQDALKKKSGNGKKEPTIKEAAQKESSSASKKDIRDTKEGTLKTTPLRTRDLTAPQPSQQPKDLSR
jgi:chromosome segregation ATPase